ncbi:MAG: hypothetical protein AAF171_05020 [Cyanobacteria bacterium P01_A01_bin.116]
MSERLAYVQQLETQITAAKSKLDQLKAEQKEVLIAAQQEEVQNLEKYFDEANINLKGISESGEEAWQSLKEDAERLLENIKSALKRLLGE